MSRVILDPKHVSEVRNYTFDFTSKLAVLETISTQIVAVSVYSGTDATPSTIINGPATASGNIVTQSFKAGVIGPVYEAFCTITTSLGQTLTLSAFFVVIPDLT